MNFNIILHQLKKIPVLAMFYFVTALFTWGIGMISPYISGLYINSLIKAISFTNLILFITLVASLNLLQMLFDYWQSILSVKLNQTLIYNISNDLFQKIFHSRYEQYGNIDCSYYVDQINKDSHLIVQFFLQNAAAIIFQSITIVVSGVIIFRVDKILCVIVFLLIPFYIASFKLNDKKMYSSRKKRKEAANKYFSCYSEQIGKLRHIKQATLYKEMENRLFLAFDTMLHAELNSTKIDSCFAPSSTCFNIFSRFMQLTRETSSPASSMFAGIRSTPSAWCRTPSPGGMLWSFMAFAIKVERVVGSSSGCCQPMLMVSDPCGSASTNKTFLPSIANPMPRFSQVVVLPVPPFWLTMAIVVHFFAIKSPPRGAMRKVMVRSILID